MIPLIKKIIKNGVVTRDLCDCAPEERYRGQIAVSALPCRADCARCVQACPVNAIHASDTTISVDDSQCIFCGACTLVCPAGVLYHSDNDRLAYVHHDSQLLSASIRKLLGRSMHIRHLDVGSCNACDFELQAMLNPIYDMQQYGIDFVASPRHADVLMVTGCVTANLTQALHMTHEATPTPKIVVALGSCACGGGPFGSSYATSAPRVDSNLAVDIYIPGCPPRPAAIIHGLLKAVGRMKQ